MGKHINPLTFYRDKKTSGASHSLEWVSLLGLSYPAPPQRALQGKYFPSIQVEKANKYRGTSLIRKYLPL